MHKKPAVRRVFCFSRRSAAGGDHVFRLQALVPLYHRELHALAFDEDAVAFAANRSDHPARPYSSEQVEAIRGKLRMVLTDGFRFAGEA